MKGFKTKEQMMQGHYCWGGKVMKKAEGGSVRSRFNSAFAEARNKGDKTFDFEGKKYTTEMAKPRKAMSGRANPETETNEYKESESRPSVEESTVAMPGGSRPSAEENARPTPPKQKNGYTLPDIGLRVGKKGEPAITTGPSEPKEGTSKAQMDEVKNSLRKTDEDMLAGDRARMLKAKGGMAKGGNWIAGAVKNKGALHRDLGVPQGKKIPASKINAATHSSNPTVAKRARLAKTLKSFHKG
jgi:hypothetical protein